MVISLVSAGDQPDSPSCWAAAQRSAWARGSAAWEINDRACARWLRPKTGAMPCSVTTAECWNDVIGDVATPMMVDDAVFSCQLGKAMIAWPPSACIAPTVKSLCPPKPE